MIQKCLFREVIFVVIAAKNSAKHSLSDRKKSHFAEMESNHVMMWPMHDWIT